MNAATLCLVLLVPFGQLLAPADTSVDRGSDLGVLKHYEGTWDCVFKIESTTDADPPKQFTGVVEGKWVVGDRFLEQTGRYQLSEDSSPLVIRTMMSFDQKQSRYQYDYFTSSGEVHRSYGKWDKSAKTMTSTITDSDGKVTTIVANFSNPDVEKWTIETKDRDGQSTIKLIGTNKRRQDE